MLNTTITLTDMHEHLNAAWKLFHAKRLDLAYDQFQKILNNDRQETPDALFAEAMSGVGLIFKSRNRIREAKSCFKKAYESHPDVPMYLMEYGDMCKQMKWYSEAIKSYERCIEHHHIQDIRLLTRLAECYDLVGNFVKSKEYYLKAYHIEPANKFVLLGLGYLYYHNHLYLDAIQYWESLDEKELTDNDAILSRIGLCYYKRKDYTAAIRYYRAAYQKNEKNIYAIYGLAKCYGELHDVENEKLFYTLLYQLNTDPKNILCLLTGFYRKDARYDKLIVDYKALEEKVGPMNALYAIAGKEYITSFFKNKILNYLYFNPSIDDAMKKQIALELPFHTHEPNSVAK